MRAIQPTTGGYATTFIIERQYAPMQYDKFDDPTHINATVNFVEVRHDIVKLAFSIDVTQDSLLYVRPALIQQQGAITSDPAFLCFTQQMTALLQQERRLRQEAETKQRQAENKAYHADLAAKEAIHRKNRYFRLWRAMAMKCRKAGIKPMLGATGRKK